MQENKFFDELADSYDENFTYTITGKAQREIVHKYLLKKVFTGCSVLEINCGTGEDALFLSKTGCKVLATDASENMISQYLKKSKDENTPLFRKLAFNELSILQNDKKFDLIFSDFSGLNCLQHSEFDELSGIFFSLLKPGGKLIIVVFGKKCLWEKLYMFLKGRFIDINRRNNDVKVKLKSGTEISVYYYSPHEIRQFFSPDFIYVDKRPVGLFLPPNYLDKFFKNKKIVFRILGFFDFMFRRFSYLSDFADHYIIELRAK